MTPTFSVPPGFKPRTMLDCQPTEVRPSPSTSFQFRRLSVQPKPRTSQDHPREMGSQEFNDNNTTKREPVHGETGHVPNRSSHHHQKASSLRTSPHEDHSVAPSKPEVCGLFQKATCISISWN